MEDKLNVKSVNIQKKKLIKLWDNGAEASRELNINGGHISSCCNNKRKTAGGYIWRFMD